MTMAEDIRNKVIATTDDLDYVNYKLSRAAHYWSEIVTGACAHTPAWFKAKRRIGEPMIVYVTYTSTGVPVYHSEPGYYDYSYDYDYDDDDNHYDVDD